ncbi:hypothetical protein GF374_02075, partial [Candidatus Woesearchaeota archaeon]|nr:hypothetical protein [Candidatus Woesearchaeota archaeon]
MKNSKSLDSLQTEFTFFPLDVDYKVVDNQTVVRLFGVTPDKKKILVYDKNFAPYFKAIIRPNVNANKFVNALKNLEIKNKENILKIQGVQIKEEVFLKEKVKVDKI